MSHPPKNSPPMYNCGNVGQLLYVFIPTLNCSLAKMSTSVNGTFMLCKICTHVFENPHFGADFVPFMNKTTLFSVTHLSICVFSSGPRFARILNVVDDFFSLTLVLVVVELKEEEIDVLAPLEERIEGEDKEVKVVVAIIILAAFRFCVSVCVCVYIERRRTLLGKLREREEPWKSTRSRLGVQGEKAENNRQRENKTNRENSFLFWWPGHVSLLKGRREKVSRGYEIDDVRESARAFYIYHTLYICREDRGEEIKRDDDDVDDASSSSSLPRGRSLFLVVGY